MADRTDAREVPGRAGAARAASADAPGWTLALALLAPFVLYVACVLLLGDFIIDDAGISFAYARSVAHGDGFVSQPGRLPVEGFSNFLWVLVLAPSFWLRLFHPVITPKVLGALGVLGGFALLQRVLARWSGSLWPGVVLCTLCAVSPPLVIWSASGLENGLFFLLVTALFALAALRPRRWQLGAGAVAALLAMTRPDGLVFAGAAAFVCLGEAIAARRAVRAALLSIGRCLGGFALLAVPFFGYRLSVFHLPWPQTYYAKRDYGSAGERLACLTDKPEVAWRKVTDLAQALAGSRSNAYHGPDCQDLGRALAWPPGLWLLLATFAAVALLAVKRRLPFELWVAVVLQLTALGAFVWVENDWMGEYRFATAAVATSWLAFVLAATTLLAEARRRWPRARLLEGRGSAAIGWALCTALALVESAPRLWRFASNPPTTFADVAREARRFNAYADMLGLAKGSILAADVGGMLWESRLTLYDTMGLCEPEVVRLLKRGTPVWYYDHPLFYDWVFGTIRPTFVRLRGFATNLTRLEMDPRFARDYVPINAVDDAYVARAFGAALHSGDFVRRDALPDAAAVERLRAYNEGDRDDPLDVRLAEALGFDVDVPRGASAGELRRAASLLRAEGNSHRAATILGRLLARSPDDRDALRELGETLDDVGRHDEARAAWTRLFDAAVAQRDRDLVARAQARLADPWSATAQEQGMARGLAALYQDRRPEAAIAAFRQVLVMNPVHYGATYQLAVALDQTGAHEEAAPLWAKVLAMAATYEDATTAAAATRRLAPSLQRKQELPR